MTPVTDGQINDGYKCSCGEVFENGHKFFSHIGRANKLAKKNGTPHHDSMGRVDMVTGEITMPPYKDRTPEQKNESRHGKKALSLGADGTTRSIRTTDVLAQASEIRFVPRIYSTVYTAIMQQGQDAAVKVWGWRGDMPFENFLDTIIFLYFKEHGIELGRYTVDPKAYITNKEGNGDNNVQDTPAQDTPPLLVANNKDTSSSGGK